MNFNFFYEYLAILLPRSGKVFSIFATDIRKIMEF